MTTKDDFFGVSERGISPLLRDGMGGKVMRCKQMEVPVAEYIFICDTIEGKESHVGNIQFWFLNINHLSI